LRLGEIKTRNGTLSTPQKIAAWQTSTNYTTTDILADGMRIGECIFQGSSDSTAPELPVTRFQRACAHVFFWIHSVIIASKVKKGKRIVLHLAESLD